MNRIRTLAVLLALALPGCTAAVGDLNSFNTFSDACDPRGAQVQGSDLVLDLRNMTAHVDQNVFFAITVTDEMGTPNIEGMAVLAPLDQPNITITIPEAMPATPSDLEFWADFNTNGAFDDLSHSPPDHQWTRPICPNGRVTFTHTTPFQDVTGAVGTGAVFDFQVPMVFQTATVFDHTLWIRVTQELDGGARQTRAYYRHGHGAPPVADMVVGGDIIGEMRGPIDQGTLYEIELVVDVNEDNRRGAEDFVCTFTQRAPNTATWTFQPTLADLASCDAPPGFDPRP